MRMVEARMKTFSSITWVPLRHGAVALSGRPKIRALRDLAAREACTHVLTLISEREGAAELGAAVQAANLTWLWLPFPNGTPPGKKRDAELLEVFALAVRILDREDGRLLIHCSAGIHRTGMVAYALLRFAGHDAATAREKLRLLRTVTCEGVGEYRLAWAEELACRIGPSV
jgi:protein-tyrosine phosphatase